MKQVQTEAVTLHLQGNHYINIMYIQIERTWIYRKFFLKKKHIDDNNSYMCGDIYTKFC